MVIDLCLINFIEIQMGLLFLLIKSFYKTICLQLDPVQNQRLFVTYHSGNGHKIYCNADSNSIYRLLAQSVFQIQFESISIKWKPIQEVLLVYYQEFFTQQQKIVAEKAFHLIASLGTSGLSNQTKSRMLFESQQVTAFHLL